MKMFQKYLAWAFPINSPYLEIFNEQINRVKEFGLMKKLISNQVRCPVIRWSNSKARKRFGQKSDFDYKLRSYGVQNLSVNQQIMTWSVPKDVIFFLIGWSSSSKWKFYEIRLYFHNENPIKFYFGFKRSNYRK